MYILAWKLLKIGVTNFSLKKTSSYITKKKKRVKKYIETRDKWNQPKEPKNPLC